MVDDILELVEAHYTPRVQEDLTKALELKRAAEQFIREVFKLEEPGKGKVKANATPEQEEEYNNAIRQRDELKSQIILINESIEDKVLDSELFLREAKQLMLSKPKDIQKQFFRHLA